MEKVNAFSEIQTLLMETLANMNQKKGKLRER